MILSAIVVMAMHQVPHQARTGGEKPHRWAGASVMVTRMGASQELEIIVSLRPGGDGVRVADWFEARGFSTLQMRVGVLVSGDATRVARVFAVDLDSLRGRDQQSVPLPIPDDLATDIIAISVRGLPSLHGRP